MAQFAGCRMRHSEDTVYCSKCGGGVSEGTAFCPACGQATSAVVPSIGGGIPVANTSTTAAAPGNYPVTPVVAPMAYLSAGVQYAGFWLRVVAYVIDGIVMGVAFMALFLPFAIMTGLAAALGSIHPGEDPRDVGAVLGGTFFLGLVTIVALGIVGGWLYHAKMESSAWEATLGKKALNLRVTDLNGARVSFKRATGRHFAKLITGLIPLGVGFALAGLTERRQALHDMLANCLVLRDG
jgi:uncharacterized RDD family membrane protein YckC